MGGEVVGSLLLGLYDERGRLQQVGSASSFTAARRIELRSELPADTTDHPWARSPQQVSVRRGDRHAGARALTKVCI